MERDSPTRGALDVELIDDLDRLDRLEAEWRELAIGRGNAFITPEWLRAWWRHYGEGHRPLVGAAWDKDRLRGVIPLVSSTSRRAPTLRFAGSTLGDHFHPASSAADEWDVAVAVGEAIHAALDHPPTIVLENVDTGGAWWRGLAGAVGAAPAIVARESVLPLARLGTEGWDGYLARRSRNLRSQIGRRRRALEREHSVRVRWTEGATVAEDVGILFRLHDARWNAREGESSLTSPRARAFHADFARAADRSGWLRLCFLELDGAPVAAWHGWRIGERYAYYQAGFDPDWAEKSVGFVLFAETLRAAAEEGASEYTMLLGDEPFKLRFADSEQRVCTVLLAPTLRPARLAAAAEERARSIARRLPAGSRERIRRLGSRALDRLPLARRR